MANAKDKIEKEGLTFYALIQQGFDSKEPWFTLGKRELGVGGIVCEMYDKKTNKITKNCLLHITPTANIVQSDKNEWPDINLADKDAQIDPMTPRYWFTNTNYDT